MYKSELQRATYEIDDEIDGMPVRGTYTVDGKRGVEEINASALDSNGAIEGTLVVNSSGFIAITTMPGADPAEVNTVLLGVLGKIKTEIAER